MQAQVSKDSPKGIMGNRDHELCIWNPFSIMSLILQGRVTRRAERRRVRGAVADVEEERLGGRRGGDFKLDGWENAWGR